MLSFSDDKSASEENKCLLALFFDECGVSKSSSLFLFDNLTSGKHFFECLFKASDLVNFLLQFLHVYGFSPNIHLMIFFFFS